jgi:hypothetical protein
MNSICSTDYAVDVLMVRALLQELGDAYWGRDGVGYDIVENTDEGMWILVSRKVRRDSTALQMGWRVQLCTMTGIRQSCWFAVQHAKPISPSGLHYYPTHTVKFDAATLAARNIYINGFTEHYSITQNLSHNQLQDVLLIACEHGPCPVLWAVLY